MSQTTKRRKAQETIDYSFRIFSVSTSTVDEATRSIEGVIATDNPIPEPDFKRRAIIPRSIVMSGLEIPRQIPLLDSHNRSSVKDQLGSIRNLRVENGQVIGRLYFAKDAQAEWDKVRDGHVTDLSAGIRLRSEQYIPEGEQKTILGRVYNGPQNVATSSLLFEGSLTPVGADENAKLRGFDPISFPQQDEEFTMNEKLRALLLQRGMPADLDDDKAQEWLLENPDALKREAQKDTVERDAKGFNNPFKAEDIVRQLDELAQKRESERIAKRAAYHAEVNAACELADMPTEFARQFYDDPLFDLVAVRAKIKDAKAERAKTGLPGSGFSNPRIVGEGRDTFKKDIAAHFVERSIQQNSFREATVKKILPDNERGKDTSKWKNASLLDVARQCLEMDGVPYEELRYADSVRISQAAIAGPQMFGFSVRSDYPYHTTGSFTYLTENTLKKTLEGAYQDAASSWETVFSIGQSFTDFKPKKIYTLSTAANLTIWPDGEEPDMTTLMDTRDSYGVEVYAKSLQFSWQLLLNDDLSALTRAPAELGAAARRTLNRYAWSLLTANPTMRDGQALLLATPAGNRQKSNYVGSGGAAPSVTTLGTLTNLMRQQVGENTREGSAPSQILNLTPRYIVVPSALEVVTNQLVNSAYDPSSSVNNMVYNPARTLTPIIEPILDASSATKWYIFADKSQISTFEISFLAGHESPVVWSDMDTKTLTRWFAVRQGYGGKALHWQGVAANVGA